MVISTSSVSAYPRVPLVLGHSLESPRTTQRPFLTPTTTHKSLQIQFSAYNPPHANPYKSTKDLILPPLELDPPQFISSSTPDPRSPGRMMEPKSQPMDTHFAGSLDLQLGLPSVEDLTPLHQTLITPELASAFGIVPTTCSTKFLREPCEPLKLFPEKSESEGGKVRRRADETSGDAGGGSDDCYSGGDESGSSNRAVKRPRLVWTPQLHKRFVDVIDELGVDKAVPKTIMEMMNVEGLTRENVASHLQKYRLYLKKGNSNSSPISISSTSTGGRASTSSAFECGNGGFGPLPLLSGMHFNPMTMVPLPPPAMLMGPTPFRYGVGQLAPGGSGKVGFCGMESGGFNSSMLWNRHGG